MQIRERLSLLVLLLALFILCVLMFRSPNSRQAIRPQPIEAAFSQIRIGMTEQELVALMVPYREVKTGHSQWRYWTNGRTAILVTVWPKDYRPIGPPGQEPDGPEPDGPDLVQGREMVKEPVNPR
jgi:hypothetical protein